MTILKSTLLAAAATVAIASAAYAADPIMPMPVVPVVPAPSAFDWNGFYAGANIGGQTNIDAVAPADEDTYFTLGAQAGVNAQFDFFLIGAEVAIDGVFDDEETYAYGAALARGGVVFDRFLAYGAIGYGTDFDSDVVNAPGDHVLAGGGLEFAATDSISVRGQYLYGFEQGSSDNDIHKFQLGANFHF